MDWPQFKSIVMASLKSWFKCICLYSHLLGSWTRLALSCCFTVLILTNSKHCEYFWHVNIQWCYLVDHSLKKKKITCVSYISSVLGNRFVWAKGPFWDWLPGKETYERITERHWGAIFRPAKNRKSAPLREYIGTLQHILWPNAQSPYNYSLVKGGKVSPGSQSACLSDPNEM